MSLHEERAAARTTITSAKRIRDRAQQRADHFAREVTRGKDPNAKGVLGHALKALVQARADLPRAEATLAELG